ncbi:Serine/threonine-protein kinase AFC2 [Camellia lanceoleosa]|uniref:Serine/threonine-protein kinase AFC2 n=1 Tax=Camellia lanceoleosa TaxID=1840588 RepID=A0ACC0I2T5_9ERIC|nr:Serine/threonine-protein kinase AFC2 [Camellia lanceoleosa]
MEMERMIEFPHAYMDRRPRTRPRLGWDVAPQALKIGFGKRFIIIHPMETGSPNVLWVEAIFMGLNENGLLVKLHESQVCSLKN